MASLSGNRATTWFPRWRPASISFGRAHTYKWTHAHKNIRRQQRSTAYTERNRWFFNNVFEELNHDKENQQTEVHNNDTGDAVNVKRPSKASRNFAKPVSYKDITEAMQKAVQSIEGTKRQYREVLCNEIVQMFFNAWERGI